MSIVSDSPTFENVRYIRIYIFTKFHFVHILYNCYGILSYLVFCVNILRPF